MPELPVPHKGFNIPEVASEPHAGFKVPELAKEATSVVSKPAEAPLPASASERVRNWLLRNFGV